MNFKHVAWILSFLFAFAIGAPASLASDKSEVVDAVHRYFESLEPDKLQTALAMCDSQVSILDEFPPHEWHGPTACADWWKGLLAYNDKSGITDADATLGTPLTVDVNGDYAYFVAPMTYTYKQHGKPIKETASFAVALRRAQAGWRITGWAYSKQTIE
jgi:SnoaL-like protein